jgi:glutathione S-transferase
VWATAQSPSVTQSPPRRTTRAQLALRLPISPGPRHRPADALAWALEELRLDYETVAVSPEQCGDGEHLARHPLGRVPALELADGQILFESTAIVLAIADMHPQDGFIGPPGSTLRGQVYEWSIFAMTELERTALAARPATADVQEEFRAHNRRAAQLAAAAIERQLGDSEFLLGDSLSAADIVVGGVLAVVDHIGLLETVPEPAAAISDASRVGRRTHVRWSGPSHGSSGSRSVCGQRLSALAANRATKRGQAG